MRKLYNILVNNNFSVKRRYEAFVLSHSRLHHVCPFISWFYLLLLNIKYNLFKVSDRKKPKGKNESGTGFKYSVTEIADILSKGDIVSFDMFDTLVLRPFKSPRDVFYLLGQRLDIPDFRNLRVNAESDARKKKYKEIGTGEITLRDIYDELISTVGTLCKNGAEIEEQTELSICSPNPFMKMVWDELIKRGKTIVVTTDMYLSQSTLKAMLSKCGYKGYDRMFLSNEYGYGKYDGRLYEELKKAYPNKSIYHIGDNYNSDVARAKEHGINAVHYPNVDTRGEEYRPESMSHLIGSAYKGIVNNRLYAGEKCTPAYEYGYKCGGIIVTGFCRFIHNEAMLTGAEKILFFARDGYILKQLYDKLYPNEKTEYVYWSRSTAAKLCAEIFPQDYFRRFLSQKTSRNIPLKDILSSMGLSNIKLSFKDDTILTKDNLNDITKELYTRLDDIKREYADMYSYGDRYLSDIVGNAKNIITVDCGWAGSGNILFEAYLKHRLKLDIKVTGLLAGTNSYNQLDSDFSEYYFTCGKLKAYCFSSDKNRNFYEQHFPGKNHNIYFELLFGAPHPSCTGFDKNGPVFDRENENEALVKEIHKGELDFANDYITAFKDFPYMLNISGSDAYAPFGFSTGCDYASKVFADCVFDDTTAGKKEKLV